MTNTHRNGQTYSPEVIKHLLIEKGYVTIKKEEVKTEQKKETKVETKQDKIREKKIFHKIPFDLDLYF